MRIVGETRRPPRALTRPPRARPHPWSPRLQGASVAFVEDRVAREVERHVQAGAREGREVLGLLAGDRFSLPSGEVVSIAMAAVTAPLQAGGAHVRFDTKKFGELAGALEALDFEYVLVGWYHSHLGLGCFLSPTDLSTQQRYFRERHQFAWVLDPVRKETVAFRLEGKAAEALVVCEFDARKEWGDSLAAPTVRRTPSRKRAPYTPR